MMVARQPEPGKNQIIRIDRRAHRRYVLVHRVGLIHVAGSSELCLIRNISAAGLVARIYRRMLVGEQVQIELATGQPLSGAVVWTREWEIGIGFSGLIDVEAVLGTRWICENGKRARMPRISLSCPARLRVGTRIHKARLVNISQNGAKVRTRVPLQQGEQVLITLPDLPPMRGSIRWTDETVAGLCFDETVPFEALARWLEERRNRSGDEAPENGLNCLKGCP